MIVDIGMTVLLLLLMTYELIGAATHEWLGIGIFLLFVIHHMLNGKWCRNLLRGKYTPLRIWQTFLVIDILLTMAGSIISGMILSEHALAFLPINGGRAFARNLHMVSVYWGFVLMALHLGLHWNMVIGAAKQIVGTASKTYRRFLRGIGFLVAGYGIYAFWQRNIWNYMILKNHFVFFDFEEPLIFFLIDYIAVLTLFVLAGYYLSKGMKYAIRSQNNFKKTKNTQGK